MRYFVLILTLLIIPTILAEQIEDVTITMRVHNRTIEIINPEYSGNNRNESFEIVNGSVTYKEFSYPIIFIKNESEIVDINLFDKYILCLNEKSTCETNLGKWDAAWNLCRQDLEKYEGENATNYKQDLDNCNLIVRERDLTIESKQTKIGNLEEDEEEKRNTKWIYGVIGAVLGGIGVAYKFGKIGGGVKDTSSDEFNVNQAA